MPAWLVSVPRFRKVFFNQTDTMFFGVARRHAGRAGCVRYTGMFAGEENPAQGHAGFSAQGKTGGVKTPSSLAAGAVLRFAPTIGG